MTDQDRELSRPRRRLGVVALLVITAGLALSGALTAGAQTTTPTTGAANGGAPSTDVTITTDDIVVAELQANQLSVVRNGKATKLIGGLKTPNGVAVLNDGSIVVADSGNGRLVGYGGRFGDALKPIVDLEFPEGLGIAADGTLYVTLLTKGEVGRVDVNAGTYTKIAGDLKGPGDVALRNGRLLVTEGAAGGQDVVEINPADGKKTVVAKGFEQPVGIAVGPDGSMFVADYAANRVARVLDDGTVSTFAAVDQPAQVTTSPIPVIAGQPFTVLVTAKEGLLGFDPSGARTQTVSLELPTGVATKFGPLTSSTSTTTTSPTGTTPGGAQNPTRTTAPRRTTTTTDPSAAAPATESSSSSSLLVGILILLLVAVVGVVAFLVLRKPKNMEQAGFEERPLDADNIAEAFGPCAAEEVELAEAEGARDAMIVQREAAEKRMADAAERAQRARDREQAARDEKAQAGAPTETASEPEPEPEDSEIKPGELGLTTDAGREALAAFSKGELDAHQLEERWRELGEQQAIDVVRRVGEARAQRQAERAAREAERVAADPELSARAEAEEAEKDKDYAEAEITRLREREAEAIERITIARERLEACQQRHEREQTKAQEAADAAEAAAAASASASAADGSSPATDAPGEPEPPAPRSPRDSKDSTKGSSDAGPSDAGPSETGSTETGPSDAGSSDTDAPRPPATDPLEPRMGARGAKDGGAAAASESSVAGDDEDGDAGSSGDAKKPAGD